MGEVLEFTVGPDSGSERLDILLARASGLSRAKVQRLIEQGHVLVDGQVKKARFKPSPGQKVRLSIPPPEPRALAPEPIPLKILYEDDDLLVINKPPGLVVHPGAGHETGTLVNALLHHSPEVARIGGKDRPGIVHRLDKDTSGVMVVAKTETAQRSLQQQFKERRVKKTYLAFVRRVVKEDQGRIELPINRLKEDRKRMGVGRRGGREAATTYRVLGRFPEFTLLELHPETGRTHQIRVHLSAIGHPVVGDKVYGGKEERQKVNGKKRTAKREVKAERQLLHAWKLGFFHPRTREWMEFEAPLPEDFKPFLSGEALSSPFKGPT